MALEFVVVLTASGVTLSRGGRLVLDDVTVAVGPRSRTGLVGPNGIGKTTLLRVLAGLEVPDAGSVVRSPRTLTVGYLPQEPLARGDGDAGETLYAYLERRTGVAAAEVELDRALAKLDALGSAVDTATLETYDDALERFLALGGDDLRHRAREICSDLGIPVDRLDVPLAALSGGQAARAALAAVLLSRFDVFLLDEPTNNLDFDGLAQLEEFLGGLAGGVLVVSHDRAFLDRCVGRIVELQEETHRAAEYAGGWSEYVEARRLARTQQSDAFEQYRAERQRLAERGREQRAWAQAGARRERRNPKDNDRAQRGFRIDRTEKQASKVRATERALERLEPVGKPWEGWELRLLFPPQARSGDVVARLEGAVVRRGEFTLGPVDLEIRWKERVAVTGPNGAGKSTLILALLGGIGLDGGKRYVGPGVKFGLMDQARAGYAGEADVLSTFMGATGVDRVSEARSLLAKFGLGATHVERAAHSLSPGERTRAVLATLVAGGVNCLVLDEPTNHLDVAAIEELEHALDAFEGTLVLVSHDRRMLDAVHVTRRVHVRAGAAAVEEPPVR